MNTRFYGVYNPIEITDEEYEIGDLLAEDCLMDSVKNDTHKNIWCRWL